MYKQELHFTWELNKKLGIISCNKNIYTNVKSPYEDIYNLEIGCLISFVGKTSFDHYYAVFKNKSYLNSSKSISRHKAYQNQPQKR